jgi:hypothetical protein
MPPQNHNQHNDGEFRFDEDKPLVLSPYTIALPLWATISISGFFIICTFYFVTLLNTINNKLDKAYEDRWKLSYQREWGYEMHDKNPNFTVPDADNIANKLK